MNCYESNKVVNAFDLLVAEDTEFDLTYNKVYVCYGTQDGLILIQNDKNVKEYYSLEYFRFYEGETIDGFPI